MSILARLSTQQTAIAIKPRRGAVDLAPKFVADLANIHILAAIASCLDHQISSRRGREKLSLRPRTRRKAMTLEQQSAVAKGRAMRVEWQVGFWIGAFALFMLMLWLFSGVLLPFAAALVIGYLLDPVVGALQKMGVGRAPATLLILTVLILVVVLIFVLIVPVLAHQLAEFVKSLPDILSKLQSLIVAAGESLAKDYGGVFLERFGLQGTNAPDIRASVNDLFGQAARFSGSFLNSLLARGVALISLVSLIVVTPVVAFYILLDWPKMIAAVDGLVPPRYRPTVHQLARDIDRAIAGFLRGQSLVCFFLGAWYGLGLTLVGVNFGFLIGISAGFLSFIPYVGSLTALVLGTIVAVVQGWPHWNLPALALGVVLTGQFLEGNVLAPKLVGDSVGLHPVWLMFALLAFGSLFGFVGLIVAVPLSAAGGVLLRFAMSRYRASALYTDLPPVYSKLLQKTPTGTTAEQEG
jgi:predicted PurR-regulated permease PerM